MRFTLGNSFSCLSELTSEQYREVKDLLSYEIDASAAFHSNAFTRKRYLIDKHGVFPSGLEYLVLDWLKESNSAYLISDPRKRPITRQDSSGSINGVTPLPWQQEAVAAAVKASRGVIQAATGTGKSVAICLLIKTLGVKTLVVTPNLELKRQLSLTIKQTIGDSVPVTVENVDSPDLPTLTNYDLLILDESHHAAAKTYRKLNQKSWKNIYFRFCFTATSFRSKEEEQLLMESITGPVIYSLPYTKAVEQGYIVPVEAYYYNLPKQTMKGNPRHWQAVYSELVVNNIFRNQLVKNLIFALEGHPTVCLVREIRHGDILSALTGVSFVKGQHDLSRQFILEFCLEETKALIGTVGVLGEGVDTKPASWVIMAHGGKSKTQFMQCVGRGVRKYQDKTACKIIMFRDTSNPYLLKHFKACVQYLRDEYSVVPVKLDYPDNM